MQWTTKSSPPHKSRTLREHRVDGRRLRDVTVADDLRIEVPGEGLDPLLQSVALIGEGEVGALTVGGLGDAPGDRPVVGDPHDQAALARKDARLRLRHESPESS